ncbi:hypothetical protein J437_LFUL009000 [Ladona fulva]|uniref:Uncharacterized protein n=1 Tax=Ladona fulva TaxID=123851 RepID=A0A8K0P0W4_LADFU|nr:hypothetical protein J437_LFUL009000 [Ladona fulva]
MASVRRLGLTLLLIATLAEFSSTAPIQAQESSDTDIRVRRQHPQGRRPQGHHNGGRRPGGGGGGFRPGAGGGHFGASQGLAGAQAFETNGPMGGFGASAANAGTQSVNFRPGGFSGSAGESASQNYQLPGGGSASVSFTGGVSVDSQGGTSQSGGTSVAITPPKRRPGFNG